MKPAQPKRHTAFSLVEVTLALGVVCFCLLTLIALLPLGLASMRTSRSEAAATNCMEQIAGGIRKAVLQTSGTSIGKYQASGPYNTLVWPLGGAAITSNLTNLSSSGFPSSNADDQRFTAHIVITPPANAYTTGTAQISVGWPTRATWNTSSSNWTNSQGSVQTVLIFLPNS